MKERRRRIARASLEGFLLERGIWGEEGTDESRSHEWRVNEKKKRLEKIGEFPFFSRGESRRIERVENRWEASNLDSRAWESTRKGKVAERLLHKDDIGTIAYRPIRLVIRFFFPWMVGVK